MKSTSFYLHVSSSVLCVFLKDTQQVFNRNNDLQIIVPLWTDSKLLPRNYII